MNCCDRFEKIRKQKGKYRKILREREKKLRLTGKKKKKGCTERERKGKDLGRGWEAAVKGICDGVGRSEPSIFAMRF